MTVCYWTILSCRTHQSVSYDVSCSYVFADSIRVWLHNKMPEGVRQWIEEKDSLKIFFYEEEAKKLWQGINSDLAVNELSRNCGFSWILLESSDGNKRWQLGLGLQRKDTTFIIPNNLLIYLFSKQ
jgi:hypothetical protein